MSVAVWRSACRRFRADLILQLKGQLRSLTFGKIPTTDDSSKATKESWLVAEAGTIAVAYFRIKNYREVRLTKKELQEARVSQQRAGSSTSQTLIDEASKKAASLLSASG